ncbi:MAG: DegV family protein, partial [Oscillospiraceae bacterium]|nr:DegV family protein [Oscillospiraceae bacterium]
MSKFELTCCSTADMSQEFFDERRIPYVCFHFTMDGEEYPDDLGRSMPFEEFYKRISEGAAPTTSQVTVGQFIDFFEPMLKEGRDILHISLSSGLSGAYNSAVAAADELKEKYPERTVNIVDSRGASSGYGLLVTLAADRRDAGDGCDEARDYVLERRLHIHHWFFSTDLTSYYRGGRISKTEQVLGTMLGICPLLNMDPPGHLIPREKIRGKKNVIKAITERMAQHADGGKN